jgi:hypothetical protein
MRLSRFAAALAALPMSVLPVACGTPTHSVPAGVNSVTISPAKANPGSPTGQVQFTATANYLEPPLSIILNTANWGVCINGTPSSAVTVTNTGLAACTSAASGTYTVFASLPTNCNAITACGGGCQVTGAAQLTCP